MTDNVWVHDLIKQEDGRYTFVFETYDGNDRIRVTQRNLGIHCGADRARHSGNDSGTVDYFIGFEVVDELERNHPTIEKILE